MSNTVRINVSQYDYDSNSDLKREKSWLNSKTYSYSDRQSFSTPDTTDAPAYISIDFGAITTAKFIRLQSDQVLSVKLNGGSQVFSNIKLIVLDSDITAISIQNTSGDAANIDLEIYGV